MFHFETPSFLLLLALIPLFIWMKWKRRGKESFLFYSSLSLIPEASNFRVRLFLLVPFLLRLFAFTLLIFALARPQIANVQTEVLSQGVDIMLTLDTSGSMQALDFKVNGEEVDRLTAVKKVVTDFIKHRESDRIGMVVFGEVAFTQCPLTLDYDVLLSFLDQLQIGMAGDATAIGDAVALSVKRLKDLPSKSKVIILLTDGRNNAGSITPEKAAEIAATYKIKIYTIGVGTKGPVPFPQETLFGTRKVLVELDIDEETLQKMAEETGGQFFRATDTEGLQKIYRRIDQLEKSEAKVKHFQEYYELYRYLAIPGLLLLLLELILKQTVFRRFT